MKIALIAIVAIAAGLVGGGVANMLQKGAPVSAQKAEAPDAAMARLDDLESALERIEERLHRLEVAPPMAAAPAATPVPASAEDDETASAAVVVDVPEELLEEKIRDVVAEREKSQQEERDRRRTEFETARQNELMNKLAELGLNGYQQEQLTALLAKRRDLMGKFRETMFSRDGGVDRDTLRERMRTVREQIDTEIKTLLTTDQYAAFQQMDPGGRGQGRGPGRGR